VEDSGDWCAFIEGVRNPIAAKPPYPQTLYHICPILSNHRKKVWALYMQNHGLSSLYMHEYALKSSAIFWRKILIFLKNLKKVYKGLKSQGKI
jgi:hypothetical protein